MSRAYLGGPRPTLEGYSELIEGLDGMAADVATKLGRKATREGAKLLLERIKERAPYGSLLAGAAKKYGHLRDNLKVRLARAQTEGTIVYKVTSGKAFWARFLEFGTKFIAARPFMRPATDASAQAVVDRVGTVLGVGLELHNKRVEP